MALYITDTNEDSALFPEWKIVYLTSELAREAPQYTRDEIEGAMRMAVQDPLLPHARDQVKRATLRLLDQRSRSARESNFDRAERLSRA